MPDRCQSHLQIVVAEEAAEILEAHVLAGLPPSVEQFLQIGACTILDVCILLFVGGAAL